MGETLGHGALRHSFVVATNEFKRFARAGKPRAPAGSLTSPSDTMHESRAASNQAHAPLRLTCASMRRFLVLAVLLAFAHAFAATPVEPKVPATPAGEKLQWFVSAMNERHGAIDAAEVQRLFSPRFLAQVPAASLVSLFGQLGHGLAPFHLKSIEERSPVALVALADSQQGPVRISVAVNEAAPHLFEGLLIRPAAEAAIGRPASWTDVKEALAKLAHKTALLAARVDGGRCEPVQQVAADDELAIGSTFKLYTLLAAADQVQSGKLGWDTPIAVREEWKSWPSGTLQDQPAGTKRALRDVAQQMIAISDNTAADHLLHTVGRAAVEAKLAQTHHAAPSRDLPFLTTRELFVLKVIASEAERAKFIAADTRGRRALLEQLDARPLPPVSAAAEWKKPRAIDTLEWFASPTDLCRLMTALRDAGHGDVGSPVLQILARNPGVEIDHDAWSYVGFKGGSEPGVMNLTFLLRRKADGAWFVLTLGANDPDHEIDQSKLVVITEGAMALLAKP
jgi:beta-lactamase class A